jgi:phage shock protein C
MDQRQTSRGIEGFGMGIRRAKRNRLILGVCGGIAHHFGWSPLAVRLATVLLAIFIPGPNIVVILAYFLLGYLLPETEEF